MASSGSSSARQASLPLSPPHDAAPVEPPSPRGTPAAAAVATPKSRKRPAAAGQESADAKKPRAGNWTEEQTRDLIVAHRKPAIAAAFGDDRTKKREVWERVAAELKTEPARSGEECKKKWDNVSQQAKVLAAALVQLVPVHRPSALA